MVGKLVTERLALRPLASDDLDLLADLNGDAEVMRFITAAPLSIDETRAELEAALDTRWLAFARHGGELLGWVGAIPSPERDEYDVGWRFKRSAWGHGYATEAARALIDRIFARGAWRVFAQTMVINSRSRAVMERLGLRLCRTFYLDLDDPLPGTELGEVEYELSRPDWEERHRQPRVREGWP